MTNKEMKLLFNIVYNNITSNKAPGVNDYELGQYFTMGQEQVLKEYYESVRGFETSEYVVEALQPLVREVVYHFSDATNIGSLKQPEEMVGFKEYLVFNRPENQVNPDVTPTAFYDKMLFAIYEEVNGMQEGCTVNTRYLVYPTTHNEFYSVINNPFRGSLGNRVPRIMSNNKIELWTPMEHENFVNYVLRYIKKPNPIVFGANTDYPVDDVTTAPSLNETSCELPEFLHRTIVNRAAALAKASWQA